VSSDRWPLVRHATAVPHARREVVDRPLPLRGRQNIGPPEIRRPSSLAGPGGLEPPSPWLTIRPGRPATIAPTCPAGARTVGMLGEVVRHVPCVPSTCFVAGPSHG
jgi:hypothetical protein